MGKKITILRRRFKNWGSSEVEEVLVSGELLEHAGYQFCLCRFDGFYFAIELSTGHSAASASVKLACPKKRTIDMVFSRSADEYARAAKSVMKQGLNVPLNKPIITKRINQ